MTDTKKQRKKSTSDQIQKVETNNIARAEKSKGDALAKEIGQRIVDARTGLGFSQQVLHVRTKWYDPEKNGISRAVLSLYETGVNKPGAREIRILCETLKITPNWLLYGSNSPAKTLQASLEFLHGSDLDVAVRLAYAMMAIDPVERDAFASLLFSMLTKKLGDVRLSSLMTMANYTKEGILKEIVDVLGEKASKLPMQEIMEHFIENMSEQIYTNYGNLRPAIPEEELESFDGLKNPPPPRKLKGSR